MLTPDAVAPTVFFLSTYKAITQVVVFFFYAELDRKKKLSDNRAKFIETLDQLEEAERLINPEDFETKRLKLSLHEVSDSGYSRDGFSVSISNSSLILDFIAMLKEKVSQKIEDLETELVK